MSLNVLPQSFANRRARFIRVAQTITSPPPPHVAAIYGLQEGGDVRALLMEPLEAEDLSQPIACGAITLDEALPVQSAEGSG
jgi:hypothetical protein